MKKTIALMIALAIALSLAACGGIGGKPLVSEPSLPTTTIPQSEDIDDDFVDDFDDSDDDFPSAEDPGIFGGGLLGSISSGLDRFSPALDVNKSTAAGPPHLLFGF